MWNARLEENLRYSRDTSPAPEATPGLAQSSLLPCLYDSNTGTSRYIPSPNVAARIWKVCPEVLISHGSFK